MLRFIDISNWQEGLDLEAVAPSIDAMAVKATQGLWMIDWTCDPFIEKAKALGLPYAFYHFAEGEDPIREADYFMQHTAGYFGKGIPVLDWEGSQQPGWVNSFVEHVHEVTGVWPWIYANPWRFTEEVNQNCMRWLASYPDYESPTFIQASSWEWPTAPGLVGAWQFCSDGRLSGYAHNLDCNLFDGDAAAWAAYAKGDNVEKISERVVYESDRVRVIEKEA